MLRGHGNIALRILDHARERKVNRDLTINVVDINPNMLKDGQKLFCKTMYHASERDCTHTHVVCTHSFILAPQVAFHVGNAQQLDPEKSPDNTYDLYTIAFGIRNCTLISDVINGAYRVLKPGGVFAAWSSAK